MQTETSAEPDFLDGWLRSSPDLPCLWRHSPNVNERPQDGVIDLVVIHNISLPSGSFVGQGIDALFMNELSAQSPDGLAELVGLKVSSHFLIRRSGQLIQYVSIQDRAWHAGVSSFQGRENCNDFSVGIELEGTDQVPFALVQYEVLVKLSVRLSRHLPSLAWVAGHSHIAPGRKTDPGPCFDWAHFGQTLVDQKISWRVWTNSA